MEQLNQSNAQDHSIIWIDKNIFTNEYEQYRNELGIKYYDQIPAGETTCNIPINQKGQEFEYHGYKYKIRMTNDSEEGVRIIKNIQKFSDVIIIVGENSFYNFVDKFDENLKDIYVIPQIIIFNPKKRQINSRRNNLFNCCVKEKDYRFYLNEGIKIHFDEVKNSIKSHIESLEKLKNYDYNNSATAHLGSVEVQKWAWGGVTAANRGGEVRWPKLEDSNNSHVEHRDKQSDLLFYGVKEEKDLMLPTFFKILLKSELEENNEFIQEIKKTYMKDPNYNILLYPIDKYQNIPVELLSKYYIRMYTIEGNFYKIMKQNLFKKNQNNYIYLPYIKTLYAGLEKEALKTYKGKLYSAQILSDEQIKELEKIEKSKEKNLPMAIIFSKAYLSFTKDINIAEDFYKNGKNVMLTIESSNENYNLHTHADIEKLSVIDEKEVLFFPFSAFAIKDFYKDSTGKHKYELKLEYLGKYEEKFKNDKKLESQNDLLPENIFKDFLQKSGLVEKDKIETMTVSGLKKEYKNHEKNLKKNK